MKTHKVKLYVRVRLSSGKHKFVEPAWNRNRTLREGYALVGGVPQHHPEGVYYVRYLRDGRRAWEALGSSADIVLTRLRNKQHDLKLSF